MENVIKMTEKQQQLSIIRKFSQPCSTSPISQFDFISNSIPITLPPVHLCLCTGIGPPPHQSAAYRLQSFIKCAFTLNRTRCVEYVCILGRRLLSAIPPSSERAPNQYIIQRCRRVSHRVIAFQR